MYYFKSCAHNISRLASIHLLIFIKFSKLAEIREVIPDTLKLFSWDEAVAVWVEILEHRLWKENMKKCISNNRPYMLERAVNEHIEPVKWYNIQLMSVYIDLTLHDWQILH